jgi:HD-GYP domain-containing protein (c-di-GMP phosphodiesterase class II)
MRTDRPYRKALAYRQAVAEIQANVGTQFDPRVVAALVRMVEPTGEAETARNDSPAVRSSVQPAGGAPVPKPAS